MRGDGETGPGPSDSAAATRQRFHLVLIKPTRYGDDGYPVHWHKSPLPSNSLACLFGLACDARQAKVLGADVEIVITAIDESNDHVPVGRIAKRIAKDGGRGLIGLVGVQSNQYPRALDIGLEFRRLGIQVAIGGFHVSGCLAMLGQPTPELKVALDAGISLFAGEAESGRLEQVIKDAAAGRLQPIYDFSKDLPDLSGASLPIIPASMVARTLIDSSSFDLGRGCPFECSFCCIINVQGRKSRFRSADDLEAIVRRNVAEGVTRFFVTDDNLARNRNWEACFDRLIELRAKEGIELSLQIQVDTLCHRIPRFIDKAVAAGVDKVFIGLENINPDNLAAVKKRQNRITEYREMLLDWKRHPVVITCGYIVGFPNDTYDSIQGDIEILKRELPTDILYLTFLTPLPGSEDHKRQLEAGTWMDPDLNLYDLSHRVVHHPRMSDREWERAFRDAWRRFYTPDHVERVLRRAAALGSNKKLTTVNRLFFYGTLPRLHDHYTLDMGFYRRRWRHERRPGLPRENAVWFHLREAFERLRLFTLGYLEHGRMRRLALRIWADPKRREYVDTAITRAESAAAEQETLDLYKTRGGAEAVAKARGEAEMRARVAARGGKVREAADANQTASPAAIT
jgi:pyruvate-formate lyase-activating enzyme